MKLERIVLVVVLLAAGVVIGRAIPVAVAQNESAVADRYAEMILVQQMMNGNDHKAIACKHPEFPGGMWMKGREADCERMKVTYDDSVARVQSVRRILEQYVMATRP